MYLVNTRWLWVIQRSHLLVIEKRPTHDSSRTGKERLFINLELSPWKNNQSSWTIDLKRNWNIFSSLLMPFSVNISCARPTNGYSSPWGFMTLLATSPSQLHLPFCLSVQATEREFLPNSTFQDRVQVILNQVAHYGRGWAGESRDLCNYVHSAGTTNMAQYWPTQP